MKFRKYFFFSATKSQKQKQSSHIYKKNSEDRLNFLFLKGESAETIMLTILF